MEKFLSHYGVKGMRWGIRKEEFTSPEHLSSWMRNNIGYSDFTKLKSHDEVEKTKRGSCHDQVMFAYSELKKMGLNPKAEFFVEYDPKTHAGGVTHSFVHYEKGGKTYWLENAWGGREGIHEFDSLDSIKSEINSICTKESSGFSKLKWGTFNPEDHASGESLGELLDICLNQSKTTNLQHTEDSIKSYIYDDALAHYGVLGMKWGVRKDNAFSNFTLEKSKVMLGQTPAVSYKWTDSKGSKVAQFSVFNWWDGKNVCDLEIFGEYKGRGLSYELLDYATQKCGAKNLAVRKDNGVAKHVYDKYGFQTTAQDKDYYYMTLDS